MIKSEVVITLKDDDEVKLHSNSLISLKNCIPRHKTVCVSFRFYFDIMVVVVIQFQAQ